MDFSFVTSFKNKNKLKGQFVHDELFLSFPVFLFFFSNKILQLRYWKLHFNVQKKPCISNTLNTIGIARTALTHFYVFIYILYNQLRYVLNNEWPFSLEKGCWAFMTVSKLWTQSVTRTLNCFCELEEIKNVKLMIKHHECEKQNYLTIENRDFCWCKVINVKCVWETFFPSTLIKITALGKNIQSHIYLRNYIKFNCLN